MYLAIFCGLVALTWLLWRPGGGWYWVLRKRLTLSDRILREDALKYFTHCELDDEPGSLRGAAGSLGVDGGTTSRIVNQLLDRDLLRLDNGDFHLTPEGRRYGLRMIRAHRLYETYMFEKTGFGGMDLHERAELAEHTLTEADISALDQALAFPVHDPHGDPIPGPDGNLVKPAGMINLSELPVGSSAVIAHLEDEPVAVFRQIDAAGLYPGQQVQRAQDRGPGVRFHTGDREHTLSHLAAANVQVVPGAARSASPASALADKSNNTGVAQDNLATAPQGVPVQITEISARITGTERRRLMDLGFLPGTPIVKEMVNATGDPLAFRVRGTLIALRRDQAADILVAAAAVTGTTSAATASGGAS